MTQYHGSIPTNVPVNSVSHVSVENIGFVLNLRTEVGATKSASGPPQAEERLDISMALPSASKHNRLAACTNTLCIERIKDLIIANGETQSMVQELTNLTDMLNHAEGHLTTLEEDYQLAHSTQQQLLKTLGALEAEIGTCKDTIAEAAREQRRLEEKMSVAHAVLRNEQREDVAEKKFKKPHPGRKHNGIYSAQTTGLPMWSCCLGTADAEGCIEEHSVGVRSTLGLTKLTLNDNRLLPSGGGKMARLLPHTKSMDHCPRYAFGSTSRTSSPVGTFRPGASVGGGAIHNMSWISSPPANHHQSHLDCPHDHSHAHYYSQGRPQGHHRGNQHSKTSLLASLDDEKQRSKLSAAVPWSGRRPPSAKVGTVRVEQGTLRLNNRPMTAPQSFSGRR